MRTAARLAAAALAALGALGALGALPSAADPAAAAKFLARLAGGWQGAGQVRGMAADMRMDWEPVLDGRFHRLAMENRMTGSNGQSWHFKALSFYRVAENGSIAGTWFDSRGISLPLTGRVEGDAMTIDWGTPDIERGRSTYRLTADALEVTDETYGKDGGLVVFGRTRLTREGREGV